ncbi:MAG TPA: glycosyltransferase family 2 protein [Thermofilum sp.]|nr:glycosyltransferase family 2 protein [Thermofilum sp.]
MKDVIAVIPAFNEENTIARVIVSTKRYVDEIIVVDDGSKDLTKDIAEELGAIVVAHERNKGYGAALRTGFKEALKESPKIIITLDADGQHDPSDIPKLIKPIIEGKADIVLGSRFLKESKGKVPFYRKIAISLITKLTRRSMKINISDAQSGFRAYKSDIIPLLIPTENGMGASVEILDKAASHNLKIIEVPISVSYSSGTSTHNPLYHGIDVLSSLLKFATIKHPIAFYGVPGLISLSIGLGFLIWTLRIYSIEGRVVTNIALVAVSGTIIGLLLLIAAIILYTIITIIREEKA